MLEIRWYEKDKIIEVKETIMSFHSDKFSYWYYDIINWKKSSLGKQHDKCDRVMVSNSIAWVKQHYLPLIKE